MAQTTITEEEKNGMDIFDILGPVMVGPSSSHTAGAARIGAMARTLLGEEVADAKLHLYGSFAETGKGHAIPSTRSTCATRTRTPLCWS